MQTTIKVLMLILTILLFSCSRKINFTVDSKYILEDYRDFVVYGSIEKKGKKEKRALFLKSYKKFQEYKEFETYSERKWKLKQNNDRGN